ncbi:MAG: tetratricopeptide repeat protein [Rhodopseudomonas palustris]|nr:tetratricopeptide repeat protein [Rhodopseudomonas palustris]
MFVNLWEVVLGWNETPVETITAALETARLATSLDSRDPAAQAALGWAYVMSGDIDNGLTAARRAVELNPSMPEAWGWLSAGTCWSRATPRAASKRRCARAASQPARLHVVHRQRQPVAGVRSAAGRLRRRAARRPPPAGRAARVFPRPRVRGDERGGARSPRRGPRGDREARRAYPDLSLEFVQGMYGVARPEIDARRNSALRQAGLE